MHLNHRLQRDHNTTLQLQESLRHAPNGCFHFARSLSGFESNGSLAFKFITESRGVLQFVAPLLAVVYKSGYNLKEGDIFFLNEVRHKG